MYTLQLIFISVNFGFSFVLNSLTYITIPKANGKIKINWNKKNKYNIYTSVYLVQNRENWNIVTEKWNYFVIVQSTVHCKQAFTTSWSKSETVYTLRTKARLQIIKHSILRYFSLHKGSSIPKWPLMVSKVSVVHVRCKMTEKQQTNTMCLSYRGVRWESVDCIWCLMIVLSGLWSK